MAREIQQNELNQLLQLYTHLHETTVPEESEHLAQTWQTIMRDENHHIIVKIVDDRIVSSYTWELYDYGSTSIKIPKI